MDKQDELRQWLEIADNDLAYAELWLITAYIPSPSDWSEDFRQRRKA